MEENRKRLKKGDENLKTIKKIVVLSWESTADFFFDIFQLFCFSSLIFLSNKSTSDKTEKNKFSFIGGKIFEKYIFGQSYQQRQQDSP